MRYTIFCLWWLCTLPGLFCLSPALGQDAGKFFSSRNLLPVGVWYDAPPGDPAAPAADMRQIAELGFEFVQLAANAWPRMEAQPGVFSFNWLETCIDEAAKNKLKVILYVPSASPPAWLFRLHPEILLTDETGRTASPGSSHCFNPSHAYYRFYVKRLLGQLGALFGHDRRIWGWQLEEPSLQEGFSPDYSPTALSSFHSWLMESYDSISALNQAWGPAAGTAGYRSFDEIPLPRQVEGDGKARTDFLVCTEDMLAEAVRFQADTLRKIIISQQFITTSLGSENPFLTRSLPAKNLINFTVHSASQPQFPEQGARAYSFMTQLANSLAGVTGLSEPMGNLPANVFPAGREGLLLWHAYLLGEKYLCPLPLRPAGSPGDSLPSHSILSARGNGLTPEGGRVIQSLREIRELRKFVSPEELQKDASRLPELGILRTRGPSPLLLRYYNVLCSTGRPVRFISPDRIPDPQMLPFLLIAGEPGTTSYLTASLTAYVKAGGTLVLVPFEKKLLNEDSSSLSVPATLFHLLSGMESRETTSGTTGTLTIDSASFDDCSILCTLPVAGSNPPAGIAAGPYMHQAAAVLRESGKGRILFFAFTSQDGRPEKHLLLQALKESGVHTPGLPQEVYMGQRDGFHILVNYSALPVPVPAGKKARILTGNESVLPGRVCVWMEK